MSYTYPTIEIAKVPGHKSSEPSVARIFEAIRIRDGREKSYNRNYCSEAKRSNIKFTS